MTLYDLIQAAMKAGDNFSAHSIPLKYEGQDVEITFSPARSKKAGWVINMIIEQK